MKNLNKTATDIALRLFKLLEKSNDRSAQLGKDGEAFMAVHLEKREPIERLGKVFSIAHYYTQEGDLMSDPYMEFIVTEQQQVCPILFEQHGSIPVYQQALAFNDKGAIVLRLAMQNDLAQFANMWMKNIAYQQKENLPR